MKKGKELFSEDGVAQLNTINDKHLNWLYKICN